MASAATLGAPGDALLGRFVRVQSSVRCRQDTESLPVHGRRGGLLWCSFPARAFVPCVARLRRRVTKPPGSRLTIHCAAQRHQVSEHVSAHAVLECASAAGGTADRTKAGNGRTSTEGFADDSGRACRPHTRSPECWHCKSFSVGFQEEVTARLTHLRTGFAEEASRHSCSKPGSLRCGHRRRIQGQRIPDRLP